MTNGLERAYGRLAHLQVNRNHAFLAITLLITVFMLAGIPRIYLETDFSKLQPNDMPEMVLSNRVRDTFSGQDTVFMLVELDPQITSENAVRDIRDPRVMKMLEDLSDEVSSESSVDSVMSAAAIFEYSGGVPQTADGVKRVLDSVPRSSDFFNRDFSATTMMVKSNIGSGKEKITALMDAIKKDVDQTPTPPGISVHVTGSPSLRVLIADILVRDAAYTIVLSSAIILVILILIQRSLLRGYLVFNPLAFALIWTLGTMGWLDIRLSLVTAGLGAMILGLGVEYSIFLVSKYEQEREDGKTQEDSLRISLDEVGTAILGSSSTTIVGFLALTLSIMPMLHDLGKTLALGIFYCVISSMVINPAFIVFEENTAQEIIEKIVCKRRRKNGGK